MILSNLFINNNDSLHLDLIALKDKTSDLFHELVVNTLSTSEVKELKSAEPNKKSQMIYFRVNHLWYSLTYSKKDKQLIFAQKLHNASWRFVVGHQYN